MLRMGWWDPPPWAQATVGMFSVKDFVLEWIIPEWTEIVSIITMC